MGNPQQGWKRLSSLSTWDGGGEGGSIPSVKVEHNEDTEIKKIWKPMSSRPIHSFMILRFCRGQA